MIMFLALYSFLIYLSYSLYTTPPVWVTSNYVRAGNQNVISVKTNQTATPTPNHNFFFSSPLTGTPFLGYGIKAYEGYDYLGEEQFEVNRTYLDRYQFRVVVKILGVTNILRLNVPYIAIDPSFPHHINSFDNVPVNYSAGPIANISNGNGGGTKIYTNLIDYTVQASGLVHNTFQAPYKRNKVLLFMTSMFMNGRTEKANPPPYRPIDLNVFADVISASHYNLTVTLSTQVNITRLHFSMIIFDETDVMSSGLYMLVYQKISLPYTGGFIPFPAEFADNFILGFLDFSSNKTGVILDFQWDFQTINGVHGAFMPLSVGQTDKTYGTQTINRVSYTLFYLKTWTCPAQTYFDPSQNLCTSCPIINCINCFNLTVCSTCDEFNDFFLNPTTFACDACNLVGCLNCSNLSVCQKCDSLAGYELRNRTCFRCSSVINNFINFTTESCQFCSVPNCLICSSLIQCSLCDVNNSYYLPNNTSPCNFCDNSANYFINSTTQQCQLCQILGCINCYSLFDCQTCDISNGYILNGTQCYTCFDLGTCFNGTNFTNSSNYSNTTNNSNYTNTTINNSTDNNTSNSTDSNTSNLNSSSVNITNSTVNVNNFTNTTDNSITNTTVDNSTTNGTNQMSNSTINSTNATNFTNGSFVSPFLIVEELLPTTQRTGCNSFKTVIPKELLTSRQLNPQGAYFENLGVQVTSTELNARSAEITASYSRDIDNQTLRLAISNRVDNYVFVFEYTPILPAVFYDESQCDAFKNTEVLMEIVQIISYILLIISLLSCKIVGLELFGVLQLAYFSLCQYDFFPIFLYSLRNFDTFNGLNIKFFEETASLPSVLKEINISASFLNNCNIMLILLFCELLVAFMLYVIAKFLKAKKMQLIGLRLLKQGFLTLVLFNVYNVGFSSGFHFRYAQSSEQVYKMLNLVSIVVIFAAFITSISAMLMTSSADYGQFMKKFKNNLVCRLYIPATLILRFLLGFYISTNRENSQTTLIVIAFSLTFVMYNLINLPFSEALQNYRSNIIHITQLIILLSANYYRQMKKNTPVGIKSRLHTLSIIMLIMIIFSIFFSFLVLIYEIVITVRSYINKRKIRKLQQSKTREESNQTIDDFT